MTQGHGSERRARVVELIDRDPWRARDVIDRDREIDLASSQPKRATEAGIGSIIRVRRDADGWRVDEILAPPKSALAHMYAIAGEHGLDPTFPQAVEDEVERLKMQPGIDDPALEDLTHLPFVTIDGPGTRDLDQAAYLERDGDGFVVWYALADPAHCVTVGSALFDEALRRGASYYLPGFAVPMLPRALSEDIVSLEPEQDRRAVVFRMALDAEGSCAKTEILRARVRSRAQLTFGQVERFLRDPEGHPLPVPEAAKSVALLPAIGQARLRDAAEREVVHYRRTETELRLDEAGTLKFVVELGRRGEVEQYNAQLSLLCNVEGARFLRAHADSELVQPIYRVHPSPRPKRLEELEELLEALCKRRDLDASRWTWRRDSGQSLADFLAQLPHEGPEGRLAQAIHRQAVLVNLRSTFSPEPARHHGVGAEVYARFSAPMREIVGIFLHKEVFERLSGVPSEGDDDALRSEIVNKANEAKTLQKQITREANRYAIDQLFEADRRHPLEKRPWRTGTLMGLSRGKVHVLLDDPRIDIKLYVQHLARIVGAPVTITDDGAELALGDDHCRIGDAVRVQVRERDKGRDRWMIALGTE
ncbi:MAG TPA: RNB domain-containing ribonuclease [Polyangiaceae bacterium]|nr:RNB domain-containing ribonuclease [Polyangiaceae bacterium]